MYTKITTTLFLGAITLVACKEEKLKREKVKTSIKTDSLLKVIDSLLMEVNTNYEIGVRHLDSLKKNDSVKYEAVIDAARNIIDEREIGHEDETEYYNYDPNYYEDTRLR